jgi:hypothetical protein
MIGRVIIALLIIAAAAIVTMERETAVVADMTADLAESKYADAEERAKRYEARATEAEAKATELEAKNKWLEEQAAEALRLRELSLLPLEVRVVQQSMKGVHDEAELARVARLHNASTNACFARAPTRGPKVSMRWVVQTDGRSVNMNASNVPEGFEGVVACLHEELTTWRFPPAKNGLSLAQLTWDTKSPTVAR